jgi:hypothetical protein
MTDAALKRIIRGLCMHLWARMGLKTVSTMKGDQFDIDRVRHFRDMLDDLLWRIEP